MFCGMRRKVTEKNMLDVQTWDFFEFIICLSDSGKHLIDGHLFDSTIGRTIFIPRSVSHQTIGTSDQPAVIFFVFFDQKTLLEHTTFDLQHCIRMLNTKQQYSAIPNQNSNEILRLSSLLKKEMDISSPLNHSMAGSIFAQLLVHHCRGFDLNLEVIPNRRARRILEICHFINSAPETHVSLEKMAKKAGMSRALFSTCFRKYTGMSLIKYTHEVRINKALKLLLTSHLSIPEIAYTCGFNNLGHFYNIFRKYSSISPSRFRQHTIKKKTFVPIPTNL